MSVTQTVEIPANHKLTIDVPREVPTGPVILTFTPAGDQKSADTVAEASPSYAADGLDYEGECPICAAKNYMPNAETIAAIEEGRAILRGEIPAKWFDSFEEMWEDLNRDEPDDPDD